MSLRCTTTAKLLAQESVNLAYDKEGAIAPSLVKAYKNSAVQLHPHRPKKKDISN